MQGVHILLLGELQMKIRVGIGAKCLSCLKWRVRASGEHIKSGQGEGLSALHLQLIF